jgi:cell division protein FtsI/penicillin-binding protein 2
MKFSLQSIFKRPILYSSFRWFFIIQLVFLSACSAATQVPTATSLAITATSPTLPPPAETRVKPPDAQAVAKAWLDAWAKDDYTGMYAMLTRVSQDALTREKFTARYTDVAINLTLQKLDSQILQALVLSPKSAQVAYQVTFTTAMIGTLKRETIMNLSLENNAWKVQWDDALIMPELKGGNKLALDIKVPARGDIYDRNGEPIASRTEAVALGIYPSNIDPAHEKSMVDTLAALTGKPGPWIKALYAKAQPGVYIPVGEATAEDVKSHLTALKSFGDAVQWTNFTSRYYYDGGVAPQAIGYVQSIPKESLTEYLRKGYRLDEKVGLAGLEKWGQDYLAGQRGATLYLTDSNGVNINKLAQIDPKPAQSITTTLDKNLQLVAQKAIAGFRGAIVVLERDTGKVLAMASNPGFDPNAFETTNANWSYEAQALGDPNQPELNRATQGVYPLGSTFKTVTMSAALESKLYTPQTTYNCQYTFTKTGQTLYDWTYDHKVQPSGLLTLPEGLMRSCNTYFYDIGWTLYGQLGEKPVTDMARGFGYGSATGIEQVAEVSGNMPYPQSQDEAVQMAIGQGLILATPLQVADAMAAIGNGGTLYRPQLVEKITTADGVASYTFKPEVRGKLPLSSDNLKTLQDAMRSVVENQRGTGYYYMAGLGIPVSAKTGTATNSTGNSHAWFSGYTSAGDLDKPDLGIAVLCENAGEGSEIALPIFRRMVETYFFGRPLTAYWWESTFYVTRTPVPTATPKP